MVEEPEAERQDQQPETEDEEGGPVKPFLEHLEDLRWVLIKSLATIGITFLACLLAGNYVIKVLEWPLKRAPVKGHGKVQTIRVTLGTNQIGRFYVSTNEPFAGILGTNLFTKLELQPVQVGTNMVLAFALAVDTEEANREHLPIQLMTLGPAASFIVATKVALYGGIAISSPLLFYFISAFVFPALKMREKKYVYRGVVFGAGLFLIGVCFCYFVLMPVALAASGQYSEWLGFAANQWRAEDYISFVCKFMLGMGLGFELPVVILTLVKIGILNYKMLSSARKYVLVMNFILGAVLTTPEVITQVLMAVPLQMLYEVAVWITWYWERQDKKREAAAAQAEHATG